ncbi:MAG: heparinase II/III domain-containing protein, partial [Candidatus Latescibacterota bacterium]
VFTCEWFLPVFSLKGGADSDEGILRSCKRIPLPLIVMPKANGLNALYGQDSLRNIRERYASTDWGKKEGDSIISQAKRMLDGDLTVPDGPGFAAAYYYCHEHRCSLQYQGPDRHYCPEGKEYREVDFAGVDLDRDYRTNVHERLARGTKTLATAYVLTGDAHYSRAALDIMEQYRARYFTWDWMDLDTARGTIDKGRIQFAKYMESYPFRAMVEALVLLRSADGVSRDRAARLEQGLLLPGVAEIADFSLDMICRQATVTLTALQCGLAFGNAPLTAFAVASPFGYWSLRRYGATPDGLVYGHGYSQDGFSGSLFSMAALLHNCGLDSFDPELKRLADCSFWWSSPMNPRAAADIFAVAAGHYPDPVYKAYARRTLLEGEPPALRGPVPDLSLPPSVNFPSSGLTILRRPDLSGAGTLDAEFKWGIPDNRGSFSVLSLGLNFRGYRAQSYPGHFPWGSTDLHHGWQVQSASHTTLVVDSRNQSGMKDYFKGHYQPHASEQVFYEEGDHAAVTLAHNNRIYPGVDIWRAVCVLDGVYLVADILRSEKEHTYDWWFHGVPDKSDGLTGIRAALKPRSEPLGKEDGYQMVRNLSSARAKGNLAADWTVPKEGSREEFFLSLLALNDTPLEAVHGFEWSRQYTKPEKEFLVLRRERVKNADFVVLLQPRGTNEAPVTAERFAVTDTQGREVKNAVGIRLAIGGKRCEIIVNPDGAEVKNIKGSTRKPVWVDHEN